MVQCWPAPPPPPNGMVLVQGSTNASILVSDCHFAASRTVCFRGQAGPPHPLWFGGFALFHDCSVIQIFPPRPPCGVVSVVSPKTVSFLFCFKQSDLLHPPEVRVAVFLQYRSPFAPSHSDLSPPPVVWVVLDMHYLYDGWHFGDLQHS